MPRLIIKFRKLSTLNDTYTMKIRAFYLGKKKGMTSYNASNGGLAISMYTHTGLLQLTTQNFKQ